MKQGDVDDEVNKIAESLDLPCAVHVSKELSELINPNEFLTGLGVHYLDRIKTILGILEITMIPMKESFEETIPKDGIVFPVAITKGPYIREELISIKATIQDDNDGKVILLTAILGEN
jgi:hypothetical protein